LILTIEKDEKIGRFGSVARGPRFGRQQLQLKRTAGCKTVSAANQDPLIISMLDRQEELGCDLWNYAKLQLSNLTRHIRRTHLDMKKKSLKKLKLKDHKCNICDYATHHVCNLEKHIKTIHE
jgi:hypothetical protein